ncbi:16S rRNA processing protein RimM, partial [bacterium 1XD42-8]
MEQMLQVGILSSTHGLKGEVKVFPTTDDLKRFSKLKTVFLEWEENYIELEITGVKYLKKFV